MQDLTDGKMCWWTNQTNNKPQNEGICSFLLCAMAASLRMWLQILLGEYYVCFLSIPPLIAASSSPSQSSLLTPHDCHKIEFQQYSASPMEEPKQIPTVTKNCNLFPLSFSTSSHYHSLSTLTCSHLADALIQSDLLWVQGHSPPEASRAKCLAQGHNVISHSQVSNRQPSNNQPDSLTAQPSESLNPPLFLHLFSLRWLSG